MVAGHHHTTASQVLHLLQPCPLTPLPGWSNKYNEWVEESGLVRWDKTLLEKSAVAAGNPPGDLAGRKVWGAGWEAEAGMELAVSTTWLQVRYVIGWSGA